MSCGDELDEEVRGNIASKITDPILAVNVLSKCRYLSQSEITYLESAAKNETAIQEKINSITAPMEAARMLIDCPHLTNTQEMILRDKFSGQLPTVEKELATGTVLTAKSQVVK